VANSPQARKRARQAEKRRAHNSSLRSLVRTVIKKVSAAVSSGDPVAAKTAYDSAIPVIDRMADRLKHCPHNVKRPSHTTKSRLVSRLFVVPNIYLYLSLPPLDIFRTGVMFTIYPWEIKFQSHVYLGSRAGPGILLVLPGKCSQHALLIRLRFFCIQRTLQHCPVDVPVGGQIFIIQDTQ
jgi:small subunit ribosomal protein S20